MPDFDDLFSDANEAYQSGRYREATLLYRQAAHEAKRRGDATNWYKGLVAAVRSAANGSQIRRALSFILEALADQPNEASIEDIFLSNHQSFELLAARRPVLAELEGKLDRLRSITDGVHFTKSDLLHYQARLASLRGDDEQVLTLVEQAWDIAPGSIGIIKESQARMACFACLRMDKVDWAERWIAVLERCDSEFVRWRQLGTAQLRLYVGLFRVAPSEDLKLAIRVLDDASVGFEETVRMIAVDGLSRAWLLQPTAGDPLEPSHPALQLLREHITFRQNVNNRYAWSVLHLDFRLAALRHAVGVEAVDDEYYQRPQLVPERLHPPDSAEYQRRLRRARSAVVATRGLAERLDTWLECDLRRRQVEARWARIEEIASAVHYATDSPGEEVSPR